MFPSSERFPEETVSMTMPHPPDSLFWVKQRRMLIHDRLGRFEIKEIHSLTESSSSVSLFHFSTSWVNLGPLPRTLDGAVALAACAQCAFYGA